jgi:hypothetical protein
MLNVIFSVFSSDWMMAIGPKLVVHQFLDTVFGVCRGDKENTRLASPFGDMARVPPPPPPNMLYFRTGL